MGIKSCLEENVKKNTDFPVCIAIRPVFCMWDDKNKKASNFCNKLKRLDGSIPVEFVPVNDFSTIENHIFEKLEQCRQKILEEKAFYTEKAYLLVVGEQDTISNRLKALSNTVILDFCRLEEGDVRNWYDNKEQDGSLLKQNLTAGSVRWHINESKVQAIRALLNYMAYSEEVLRSGRNAAPEYWLEYHEYHAVREDFCCHFLKLLDGQLEEAKDREKKRSETVHNETVFLVDAFAEEVEEKCLKVKDFPLTGYGDLVKELENLYSGSIMKKVKEVLSDSPIDTGVSVYHVLKILYGEVEKKPKTEWIRETMISKDIPLYCKNQLKKNGEKIKKELKSAYPLADIWKTLPAKLEKRKRKIFSGKYMGDENKRQGEEEKDRSILQLDDSIKKCMEKTFCSKSLKVRDVFDGLSEYFREWECQIRNYVRYIWISEMILFLQDIQIEIREDLKKLQDARKIFENSKIGDNIQFEFPKAYAVAEWISDENMLMEEMKTYISGAVFTWNDAVRIIKMADEKYQSTGDYYVSDDRHPELCFMYGEKFGRRFIETGLFQWVLKPVAYLPQSVFEEFKIYTYSYEKKKQESV